jgi:hypothetical protein
MENFQTPRKSAPRRRASDKIVGRHRALKIERSTTGKLPISIDFPAAVREACVGRRRSASDAESAEIRIRESRAQHTAAVAAALGAVEQVRRPSESVSRVSSSKVTPGNCKKGLLLPADQREMLLRPFPLSHALSLSPSCSSCALLLRLQFTPSIYISHPSLCVLYLPAFLQLRPSALATAHADFSKNRSIPHTQTNTQWQTHYTQSCVRWTGVLR